MFSFWWTYGHCYASSAILIVHPTGIYAISWYNDCQGSFEEYFGNPLAPNPWYSNEGDIRDQDSRLDSSPNYDGILYQWVNRKWVAITTTDPYEIIKLPPCWLSLPEDILEELLEEVTKQ